MGAASDLTLHVTHVGRDGQQSIQRKLALRLCGRSVVYAPTETVKADVERRLALESGAKAQSTTDDTRDASIFLHLTLAPLIRAFRAQLSSSAPTELTLRKWLLFCSFEGALRRKTMAGSSSSSSVTCGTCRGRSNTTPRRSIPMFRVDLSSDITAETPAMTPATSQHHHDHECGYTTVSTSSDDGVCAEEEAREAGGAQKTPPSPPRELYDNEAPQSLRDLLSQFVSEADIEAYKWSARLSVVIGDDEEGERSRREELKSAAALAFSAKNPDDSFTYEDELELENRLSAHPAFMRESVREQTRRQIMSEKQFGNILANSPPGGFFGGGSATFYEALTSNVGPHMGLTNSLAATNFASRASNNPYALAGAMTLQGDVAAYEHFPRQQASTRLLAPSGWAMGPPLPVQSNAYTLPPPPSCFTSNVGFM